jgi:hypothetical protein
MVHLAASQRGDRLAVLRLAAFPLGYGITGALAGGTLNRIMVAEMGLPLTLVGFLFALPLLEAPLRVWLGYRSDGYPILGRRREPYIVARIAARGTRSPRRGAADDVRSRWCGADHRSRAHVRRLRLRT